MKNALKTNELKKEIKYIIIFKYKLYYTLKYYNKNKFLLIGFKFYYNFRFLATFIPLIFVVFPSGLYYPI